MPPCILFFNIYGEWGRFLDPADLVGCSWWNVMLGSIVGMLEDLSGNSSLWMLDYVAKVYINYLLSSSLLLCYFKSRSFLIRFDMEFSEGIGNVSQHRVAVLFDLFAWFFSLLWGWFGRADNGFSRRSSFTLQNSFIISLFSINNSTCTRLVK